MKKLKIKKTTKRQNFVYRGKIDRVYDGDTVWVILDLGFDLFLKCCFDLNIFLALRSLRLGFDFEFL